MKSEFNLLRALYVERENPNILNEVLYLLDRDTRRKISRAVINRNSKMCDNCFSIGPPSKVLRCSSIGRPFTHSNLKYCFCKVCIEQHNRKFTIFKKCTKHEVYDLDKIGYFLVSHTCEFTGKSMNIRIPHDELYVGFFHTGRIESSINCVLPGLDWMKETGIFEW